MGTYTATQTIEAAEYVSAIVAEMRAAEIAKQEREAQEEREREQAKEARRREVLEIALSGLPARVHPFVTIEERGYSQWRAVIGLPGCAPFSVEMDGDAISNRFHHAYASIDNSGEYAPGLYVSDTFAYSTLESAIARAYEAQRVYDEDLAVWEHAEQERKHASAMSERESKLRHDEEPEPPEEMLTYAEQPAKLSDKTDAQIIAMMEACIVEMDKAATGERERYLLRRVNALSAYIQARNSSRREVDF